MREHALLPLYVSKTSLLLLLLLYTVLSYFFPSRTEGTAPAVDDIVFCPKKAGEAELLDRGYERLEPMLKAVGLGKVRASSFVWK